MKYFTLLVILKMEDLIMEIDQKTPKEFIVFLQQQVDWQKTTKEHGVFGRAAWGDFDQVKGHFMKLNGDVSATTAYLAYINRGKNGSYTIEFNGEIEPLLQKLGISIKPANAILERPVQILAR
jgi:hypothetical protein